MTLFGRPITACRQHDYEFDRSCGADVCRRCEWHKGLARCFCGWAASGGDGRDELRELGENIDEEY